MTSAVDALIIGAGVAGSSLAYALAQAGWKVALADRSRFPRHKACGEFLSPESVAILRSFGLEKAVRSLAPAPVALARLHTERGVTLEIPLPEPALGISRHSLDARLHQAARDAGAVIRTSCQAVSVKETDGVYRAELGPEREPLLARIVIGAWGRTPPQGMQPSPGNSRNRRPRVGIKGHFAGAACPSNTANCSAVDLYFFRGGYAGIASVEGGRLNVAAVLSGPVQQDGWRGAGAELERIMMQAAERVPAIRQRLAGVRLEPGTAAGAYPVAVSRKPLAWSSMPLVGDAAAVIEPLCGGGMAMALRSAALCAPLADAYLRGQISKSEWRETYSQHLNREFSGALRRGEWLARMLENPRAAGWLLNIGRVIPAASKMMYRATRIRMRV